MYNYCPSTDECLQNAANFYSKWCPDGWRNGWELDIHKDCGAKEALGVCQDFESNEGWAGRFMNDSRRRLEPKSYCTITVDAKKFVARIVLEETNFQLGVLKNGFKLSEPYTIY